MHMDKEIGFHNVIYSDGFYLILLYPFRYLLFAKI